jgi:hypothetical protein
VLPELRRLAVRAYLQRLSWDDKPILVGPYRSEVGFEALYWVPFLRWCVKQGIDSTRFVIVTRGGAYSLYSFGEPEHAVDLYALRSVTDVRRENLYDWTKTKLQKQTTCTAWDRTVLAEAAKRLGIPRRLGSDRGRAYHILHPSWMYWALAPFWEEQRGLRYLLSMTDYTPLPKPELAQEYNSKSDAMRPVVDLPKKFVAVKFYSRATFPAEHPEVRAFIADIVNALAARTAVVLLNSGHLGDDHSDTDIAGPNIHRLPHVPAEQNLALQAAVLGKATAFIGTYGGVSQLALRMGVPSVSFWTEFGGTAIAHLNLSHWLSQRTGVPYLVGSIADSILWKQVLEMPVKQEIAA